MYVTEHIGPEPEGDERIREFNQPPFGPGLWHINRFPWDVQPGFVNRGSLKRAIPRPRSLPWSREVSGGLLA